MRVEKIGGRVIITQPADERTEERRRLLLASVTVGMPGTLALLSAWQQLASSGGSVVIGTVLSLIAARTFYQSESLRDRVWTLVLNREQKTVELDGRLLATFGEVRVVRSAAIDSFRHTLSLVVHRGRGFYEIPLCSISGTAADRAIFEQAAQLIADEIGARAERR